MGEEVDLLGVDRGMVVAPAGCGKTELISSALGRHRGESPVLVLTHTHAGVAALRARLDRAGVARSAYRLATVDGWAMRLVSTFPMRAGHDPAILDSSPPDYLAVRETAERLISGGHVSSILKASYSRVLVDEYQDCSRRQHAIVAALADLVPACVLGDPLQAIFGFNREDPLAEWEADACAVFPLAGKLGTPWRWIRAGADELGRWLLSVRRPLLSGEGIDIRNAPAGVEWIELDGSREDQARRLRAGLVRAPDEGGTVLIIGDSRRPGDQRDFASRTPGAVTVESVDLRDLVDFAADLDLEAANALGKVIAFAETVMTNVGGGDLMRRVESLKRGPSRGSASGVENAALSFESHRSYAAVLGLLAEINSQSGVRVFRPSVHHACMQALRQSGPDLESFRVATVRMREEHRLVGRQLPKRAVGSTLLLKGLEADVAVILCADELDARHLYVALTRGARKVVLCSRAPVLGAATSRAATEGSGGRAARPAVQPLPGAQPSLFD